jgi:hypothetical protein
MERWRTERDYEEIEGELGLDHFEGRSLPGGITPSPSSFAATRSSCPSVCGGSPLAQTASYRLCDFRRGVNGTSPTPSSTVSRAIARAMAR